MVIFFKENDGGNLDVNKAITFTRFISMRALSMRRTNEAAGDLICLSTGLFSSRGKSKWYGWVPYSYVLTIITYSDNSIIIMINGYRERSRFPYCPGAFFGTGRGWPVKFTLKV
jgi:hypothetical protein